MGYEWLVLMIVLHNHRFLLHCRYLLCLRLLRAHFRGTLDCILYKTFVDLRLKFNDITKSIPSMMSIAHTCNLPM